MIKRGQAGVLILSTLIVIIILVGVFVVRYEIKNYNNNQTENQNVSLTENDTLNQKNMASGSANLENNNQTSGNTGGGGGGSGGSSIGENNATPVNNPPQPIFLENGLCPGTNWSPPIGIPCPEFGIGESYRMYDEVANRNPNLTYKQNLEGGYYTHYIDNTNPLATDTNNAYGNSTKPRKTIPLNLAAGSVVEVHGGPYNSSSKNGVGGMAGKICGFGYGSSDKPIFIRGISSGNKPLFTDTLYLYGSYIIAENLEFYKKSGITLRQDLPQTNIDHIVMRNIKMHGDADEETSTSAIGIGLWHLHSEYNISNILVYNNSIYNLGKVDNVTEYDYVGVSISGEEVTNAWVLDNVIHNMSSNGVRTGNNEWIDVPSDSINTFIGRNLIYSCGENAITSKLTTNVVVSQNTVYDFGSSGHNMGAALNAEYMPKNVWYIYNNISKATMGIKSSGVYGLYIIGNVITEASYGIKYWEDKGEVYIIGNTITNVGNGTYMDEYCNATRMPIVNNIISNLYDANGYHVYNYVVGQSSNISEMQNNLIYQNGNPLKIRWGGNIYSNISSFQAAKNKCSGCINQDPLFVNPSANDFRLQQNSPAIDTGIVSEVYQKFYGSFGINISVDYNNIPRPQGSAWDIGAFEHT